MFRLAHLSDPHLGPLPPVRLRELMNKRLTGYANWRLGRADAQDMDDSFRADRGCEGRAARPHRGDGRFRQYRARVRIRDDAPLSRELGHARRRERHPGQSRHLCERLGRGAHTRRSARGCKATERASRAFPFSSGAAGWRSSASRRACRPPSSSPPDGSARLRSSGWTRSWPGFAKKK